VIVELPTCVVGTLPRYVDEGGIVHTEFDLEAMEDEKTAGSTSDLALAAWRVATL
jgi:hypothetical protein